ncbi:hypothetical protein MBLNU459_g0084t1 [Dothideomycetes sp. NU459]
MVTANVLKDITSSLPLEVLAVPDTADLLDDSKSSPVYAWLKTFDEAKHDPLVALHTSGTTGIPKPIVLKQAFATILDAYRMVPSLGGRSDITADWCDKKVLLMFPLFHAGGLGIYLMCIWNKAIVVQPPPALITAKLTNELLAQTGAKVAILPPAILMEIATKPEYLKVLWDCPKVLFGGGPLPKDVGDLMSPRTHLHNVMGTSECGVFLNIQHRSEDWRFFKFSPFMGFEMREYSDGLYELVIVRDENLELFQAVFATFPHLQEYSTKDLYSKHPTKNDLWLWEGRTDDIIVLANGEKHNPTTFENVVCGDTAIKSALVFGQGRFQCSLLVEAYNEPVDFQAKTTLTNDIWPTIQRANKDCPAHGRIMRDMIVFTHPAKQVMRAGKGTVQRRPTLDLYQEEFDALYSQATDVTSEGVKATSKIDRKELEVAMMNVVREITDSEDITPNTNFFRRGFDSLAVMSLTRRIRAMIPKDEQSLLENISTKTIYDYPSISQLTSYLQGSGVHVEQNSERMQRIYDYYASDMPITRESNSAKGLSTNFRKTPVAFFKADFSEPYFGLSPEAYTVLLQTVTRVIHNAWQVDFNVSLEHLETTHIKGVRSLIDFSARSLHGASILFISSIGAVMSDKSERPIPEIIFDDWSIPLQSGYGQSKFISERLLAAATTTAGIPTGICRVGQIAGAISEKGCWPKQEWLPSLIASSKYLGKIPTSLGSSERIDWVPVDVVAKVVVDLLDSTDRYTCDAAVHHVVNPHATTWKALLPKVQSHLHLEEVSLAEWVEALRMSSETSEDVVDNPAVKLLGYFEGLVQPEGVERIPALILQTTRTAAESKTLAALGPVNDEMMDNWMRQWNF